MSIVIELAGDGAKFDQDVALAFSKINSVKKEAEKAEFSVGKLLMRASVVIGGINSAMTLTRALTGETIDLSFLAMVQNMISLQATMATFGAAQTAMGNWAWLPVGVAVMGLAASVAMQLRQQSADTQSKLEQRDQDIIVDLGDFY